MRPVQFHSPKINAECYNLSPELFSSGAHAQYIHVLMYWPPPRSVIHGAVLGPRGLTDWTDLQADKKNGRPTKMLAQNDPLRPPTAPINAETKQTKRVPRVIRVI